MRAAARAARDAGLTVDHGQLALSGPCSDCVNAA